MAAYSLGYEDFRNTIHELNELTKSFSDINGKSLVFKIKKGSDRTFFWRGTVKIKCHKVNSRTGAIDSSRQLNMKQYIHLYNEIKQQAAMADLNQLTNSDITASIIMTGLEADGLGSNSEAEECCICMDRQSEVILSCAHSYCEKCIDEWNYNNKTCPICRAKVTSTDDTWVLTEKPDATEMVYETTQYLMGLTDRCGIKDQTHDLRITPVPSSQGTSDPMTSESATSEHILSAQDTPEPVTSESVTSMSTTSAHTPV